MKKAKTIRIEFYDENKEVVDLGEADLYSPNFAQWLGTLLHMNTDFQDETEHNG